MEADMRRSFDAGASGVPLPGVETAAMPALHTGSWIQAPQKGIRLASWSTMGEDKLG